MALAISAVLHLNGILFCIWREQKPNMFRFASIVYAASPDVYWSDGRVSLPPAGSSVKPAAPRSRSPLPTVDRPGSQQEATRFAPTEMPTEFSAPVAFPGGLLDEDSVLSAVLASVAYGSGAGGAGGGLSGLRIDDEMSSIPAPPPPLPEPPPVAEATPPIRIGGNLRPPELLKQTIPNYPEQAVRANVEGAVILEASIGLDGKLRDIQVVSGHPFLVQAAVDCVKQWRYRPAVLNGQIITAPATIRVQFTIQRRR